MPRSRRSILVLVSALSLPAVAHADPGSAQLHARATAAALTLAPGETKLNGGSIAYRPAVLPAGPRPLLVALHGFGQDAEGFSKIFQKWADRCGAIVVAPSAEKGTWDIIAEARDTSRAAHADPKFGDDIKAIDSDLSQLFAATSIDPRRIALLGFSDGASYALSVGLANPDLFDWVISLSPGFALWPKDVALKQKVFVAHGTRDRRLKFSNTRDGIVQPMIDAGMTVEFRRFNGDHVMVLSIVREALETALGCDSPPAG